MANRDALIAAVFSATLTFLVMTALSGEPQPQTVRNPNRDASSRLCNENPWTKSTNEAISTWPDSTGPGLREAMTTLLFRGDKAEQQRQNPIGYGADEAVRKLEAETVWNPTASKLDNDGPLRKYVGDLLPLKKQRANPGSNPYFLEPGETAPEEMDIVLPTIRDTGVFFERWKPFIADYHVILVQDGTPEEIASRDPIQVPDWVDYELFDRTSMHELLGDKQWIISLKDASVRNFGFLLSKKKYIMSIDDDCFPYQKPDGSYVDAIREHINNLRSNSTPYMHNTLYDPYKVGSDFVRGYPFSLREGVPTVVSHGLWMSTPDYDAPTQLMKTKERNMNFAEITMTVPHGVLYPLCSMNVAFNKFLLGPAVMQGLMGVGTPWARYDDMFCGWASKVVADHLRFGSKSGYPYIWHERASNPFKNLAKEYRGITWQEEIIPWFSTRALRGSHCRTASACYRELAHQIRAELSHIHPVYFEKLAVAMESWTSAWDQIMSGRKALPKPRRSGSKKKRS